MAQNSPGKVLDFSSLQLLCILHLLNVKVLFNCKMGLLSLSSTVLCNRPMLVAD